MISALGSICRKRSKTPVAPKSGEQDDQIAPMLDAANMPTIVSGPLCVYAATRSPGVMPSLSKCAANLTLTPENDYGIVFRALPKQILRKV